MSKKILSLLLVLAMLFSLAIPALADNSAAATDPTVIYDDSSAANRKPSPNGYIKKITMSGVAVKETSFTVDGSAINVDVVLDNSVSVGATWTVTAAQNDWASPPQPPYFRQFTATSGEITWNADNTADQTFTITQAGTNATATWYIHARFDISPEVQNVINLIDAIGTVTRDSGPAIEEARAAYDALNADGQAAVTNYDVLLAAEAAYEALQGDFVKLNPPVLSASAALAGGSTVTLAAPDASAQDPDAAVEYRMSADSENWGAWQSDPTFRNLNDETTYWFQARYVTSNLVSFENSDPSAAIQVTTLAHSYINVSSYADFRTAVNGLSAGGSGTVICLINDVVMNSANAEALTIPANVDLTIDGSAGGKLIVSDGTNNRGIQVGEGVTLTLRDLTCGLVREYDMFWTPPNCAAFLFRAAGDGITLNVENVRYYNNMNQSGCLFNSVYQSRTATVNIRSLVTNPYFSNYAFLLSSSSTVNMMPTGDIYMTGQVTGPAEINVIPQSGFEILSGATRSGTAWTEMDAATLAEMNAGTTVSTSGLAGLTLNVSDAPAIPVALTAPVVAEEGTPEAETADVVYSVGKTSVTFTIKNMQSPQAASFPMIFGAMQLYGGPSGTAEYWRGYSDKSDGKNGTGNVYTFTGLKEETSYTYKPGWFSLESGWTNGIAQVTIRTEYTINQLAAPSLSDNVEKTADSITLTAPAASTQDSTAVLKYRISSDGETWGEWQESLTFEGLTPATTYYFQAMYAAADYHWTDSEPSAILEVATKTPVLTAPVLDAAAATATYNSVTLAAPAASAEDAEAAVEYRVSEDGETWGEWQDAAAFTGLTPETTYYFQARYVPSTASWLASEPSEAVTVATVSDADAPAFFVGTASGAAGTEVQVEISMRNNPGIVAVSLELNYDQEKLELVSVTDAALLPSYTGSNSTAVYPFILFWEASTATENITVNGLLATATFRVKEGAAEGDTARVWLTYDPENVYDYDMTNVTFETEEGAVTVGAAPEGFAVTVVDRVAAGTTTLTSGDYSGEVSFTVTNEKACIVLVKDEATGEYVKLAAAATEEANTYAFTFTVDKPLTVIIAVKGDVNGDGAVSVSDSALVNRSLLTPSDDPRSAYKALSPEQALIADVNGSGTVTVTDASNINRSLLSTTANAYKALEW